MFKDLCALSFIRKNNEWGNMIHVPNYDEMRVKHWHRFFTWTCSCNCLYMCVGQDPKITSSNWICNYLDIYSFQIIQTQPPKHIYHLCVALNVSNDIMITKRRFNASLRIMENEAKQWPEKSKLDTIIML